MAQPECQLRKSSLAVGVAKRFASPGTVAVAFFQDHASTAMSAPPAMKIIGLRTVRMYTFSCVFWLNLS